MSAQPDQSMQLQLQSTQGDVKLGRNGINYNISSNQPLSYHLAQPILAAVGTIQTPTTQHHVQGELFLQHMWGNWPGLSKSRTTSGPVIAL